MTATAISREVKNVCRAGGGQMPYICDRRRVVSDMRIVSRGADAIADV